MATYRLTNGYANGYAWQSDTDADAIKHCMEATRLFNTSNWLFRKQDGGKWEELGRTRKGGYFWDFEPNEGVTIDGETIKYPLP